MGLICGRRVATVTELWQTPGFFWVFWDFLCVLFCLVVWPIVAFDFLVSIPKFECGLV